MPTKYRIVMRRGDEGPEEVCAGEISDADWKLFTRFRDYAVELRSAEWVRSGLDTRYTISAQGGTGAVANVANPPSNISVREALHLLRPFVLQNEDTYFPKVSGRLWPYVDHPHLHTLLAHWRDAFSGALMRQYFTVSANDLEINDDRSLTLWLNAFEYHRDTEKQAQFIRLHGGPPDEITLAVFRDMLALKIEAVFWFADIVNAIDRASSNRKSA